MFRFLAQLFAIWLWAGTSQAQNPGNPDRIVPTDYIELAFQYGPYAFAIFSAFGARWLIRQAKQAASSSEPAVKALTKQYWRMAVAAGIAFVIFAAVGTHHWLRVAESTHVFRGEIRDLAAYEHVDADDFYFRALGKPKFEGESGSLRNERFAVIQERPFQRGQFFEITYFKQGAEKRTRLRLQYDGETMPSYRIEYDVASDAYEVRKVETQARGLKHASFFPFTATAFAQTVPVPSARLTNPQVERRAVFAQPSVDLRLVSLLQEPRTPVGAKIDALDQLRQMDAATLKTIAETVTGQESFALTLIELTRHSDKELASKARAVVEKSQADSVLARQLSSPRTQVRAAAEEALFRVNPERADVILKQVPLSERVQTLSTQVQSGEKQQILMPVGSEGGDSYYVKANWDPLNVTTVQCLTELFNREPLSKRSLQEEASLMTGRKERVVYWYTKDWALSMAGKIRACGAEASFPNPISGK